MYESLQTSDFETESRRLRESINSIVKPINVKGFIYSFFFNDGNSFGNEIKPIVTSFKNPFYRDPNLYNAEQKEISLTNEEIDFINQGYFSQRLENNYRALFHQIDPFHRHFKDIIDSNALITLYQSIIEFLDLETGAYNFQNFTTLNGLDINRFKDEVRIKLFHFKDAVNEKIEMLTKDVIENYPSQIFTNINYYKKFCLYAEKHIKDEYNDFSFLFKRMNTLKMVHSISYKDAIKWLFDESFIDDNIYDDFLIKGSFNTKASSVMRVKIFEIIFFEN